MNLINMYGDPSSPGGVNVERIGNLRDVKRLELAELGGVELGPGGNVVWAFTDASQPLEINPFAFLRTDETVRARPCRARLRCWTWQPGPLQWLPPTSYRLTQLPMSPAVFWQCSSSAMPPSALSSLVPSRGTSIDSLLG
jgi:hypothetical protein